MGGSLFVSWQNGVGPQGEPAGNGNLPANANTPPITPVPNWLATLNLNTRLLTPVASVTIHPKGLLFVAGGDEGEGGGDRGDGREGGGD